MDLSVVGVEEIFLGIGLVPKSFAPRACSITQFTRGRVGLNHIYGGLSVLELRGL